MADFFYQDPYPLLRDNTEYRKVTSDYVKVEKLGDREILTVDPKGLELLAQEAMTDVSFYLRTSHLEKLNAILSDPEAKNVNCLQILYFV
jgi:fumarate hydratase class I